jgi:O-antigen/teichoic acid export membrane protein
LISKLLAYKENLLFLIFSVIGILITIINSTILANYYSIEEFGIYQLLLTFIGVLTVFNLTGYDVFIQKKIFLLEIAYFYYVIKRIIPISLIVLWTVNGVLYFVEYDSFKLFFLASILVSFSIFDKLSSLLEINKKFKLLRYIDLSQKILFLCLSLVILSYEINLETFLESFVILYVILICIKIYYSFFLLKGRNSEIDAFDLKEFNNDAIKRTLSISYAIFVSWIERLVLGIISPALLAAFSIAYLVPKILKDNVKVLLKPTVFNWINKGKEEYLENIKKYSKWFILAGLMVFFMMNVLIYPFINFLYPLYIDSIIYSQVLSIQLIFIFYIFSISIYIIYFGSSDAYNEIINITNTMKIILSLILIPIFKIDGAIISILFPELYRQFKIYKLEVKNLKG